MNTNPFRRWDGTMLAPENYAPPVFYALSEALLVRGEKDDAAFWFYAGQIRTRFDAHK